MIQKNYKKVAILKPSWTQNITNSDWSKDYNFTFSFPFRFSTLIVVFRVTNNTNGGVGYISMTNKDSNVEHMVQVGRYYTIKLSTYITQTSIRIIMNNPDEIASTVSLDTVIAIE